MNYIYIYPRFQQSLEGGGGAAQKLCHILSSWEQMMTEHRGLSVLLTLTNYVR